MGAPRLALVGAFPFPLPQGSQVYFEGQARALTRAGADCTLFTYGRGAGPPPDDLRVVTAPSLFSPGRMRSGPSLAKPAADAALLRTLLAACRRERFDAVLAHNAEAAAIAVAARRRTHIPVCYVVHTLLGDELSAYLSPRIARGLAGPIAALGARIDRALARSVDGLVVLCEAARARLEPIARRPLVVLPPGLDPAPAPDGAARDVACSRHDLEPGHFHLYTGNLDGYQEIGLLAAAAHARAQRDTPVVVASHDAEGARHARARWPELRCIVVRDFEEMRALSAAATSLLLTRRRVGGFPVKLLNYMEAARPIVAHAAIAEGLVHDESAWLLTGDAGARDWAAAMDGLALDPAKGDRLGRAARTQLERAHAWPELAQRTLAFVAAMLGDTDA